MREREKLLLMDEIADIGSNYPRQDEVPLNLLPGASMVKPPWDKISMAPDTHSLLLQLPVNSSLVLQVGWD